MSTFDINRNVNNYDLSINTDDPLKKKNHKSQGVSKPMDDMTTQSAYEYYDNKAQAGANVQIGRDGRTDIPVNHNVSKPRSPTDYRVKSENVSNILKSISVEETDSSSGVASTSSSGISNTSDDSISDLDINKFKLPPYLHGDSDSANNSDDSIDKMD